jgi:DNA-binding GntR family transcriptional regulator
MKNNSLAQKAYDEMRTKILSQQLPQGTRLKEDQWAKSLDVSRIAIREALTRLLGEGLVMTGPKGGYFIQGLKAEEVRDVRELREILELGALRLAYAKMTKAKLDQLEKINEDFATMVKKGYWSGACEADIKFHETLVALSENKKLISTYMHSHIPLFHQKLTKTQQALNDFDQTYEEHKALVKAMRSKNLTAAEKALSKHFARGERAVLS